MTLPEGDSMHRTLVNAADAPQPAGGYAQAVAIEGHRRLLVLSGQIPVGLDGGVPEAFADQADQVWANLDAQLRAAGMSRDNLVKVTVFLADRMYAMENRAARARYLGDRSIAMTVVIAGIFDPAWLLEIEGLAVR
jgi:enamine deaminase RidA (YjgF/YER057c/UK114 family)